MRSRPKVMRQKKTNRTIQVANGLLPVDLPISIKEARKKLRGLGKNMTDDQVIEIIRQLTSVADTFLLSM